MPCLRVVNMPVVFEMLKEPSVDVQDVWFVERQGVADVLMQKGCAGKVGTCHLGLSGFLFA